MPAWPLTLFNLAALVVLPERAELAKTPVEWRISIEWEDVSCLKVCAKLDLWCTEECWPRTVEGFKRAVDSPALRDTCPGFESGGAQPWHPSKDPEGVMCYWFGGPDASLAPRCRQTPSTPANLVADYKIIRRFCPCYNASAAKDGIECNLGGEPVDPAPASLGWIPPAPSTTSTTSALPAEGDTDVKTPPSIVAAPAPPPPPPPPPVIFVPRAPVCEEMCVEGFRAEDAVLNGKYVRIATDSGGLLYWSRFGSLPNGFNCRLSCGADGRWRFYEIRGAQTNITIGEGTIKSPQGTEMPQEDYVLTPRDGFQVGFQCCPQSSSTGQPQSSQVAKQVAKDTDPESMMIIIVTALVAVLLCVLPLGYLILSKWKPGLLKFRQYKAFHDGPDKPESIVHPEAKAEWAVGHVQDVPMKTWPVGGGLDTARKGGNDWRGSAEITPFATNQSRFINHETNDSSASAIADLLGKSSTKAADDGIYEGPTRKWWNGAGRDGGAKRGLDSTGFLMGTRVRIHGLKSQQTWNGAEGTVEGFDHLQGVLQVRVADGRTKQVAPENCINLEADEDISFRPLDSTPAGLRDQLNAAQLGVGLDDGFDRTMVDLRTSSSSNQHLPTPTQRQTSWRDGSNHERRKPSNVSTSHVALHASTNGFSQTSRQASRVSFDSTMNSYAGAQAPANRQDLHQGGGWLNSQASMSSTDTGARGAGRQPVKVIAHRPTPARFDAGLGSASVQAKLPTLPSPPRASSSSHQAQRQFGSKR